MTHPSTDDQVREHGADLTPKAVLAALKAEFGPGFSNGIHAILLHPNLPEHFSKADWSGWFFKPAETAFEQAHDMGLIAPWKLGGKWRFTALGQATRLLAQEQEA